MMIIGPSDARAHVEKTSGEGRETNAPQKVLCLSLTRSSEDLQDSKIIDPCKCIVWIADTTIGLTRLGQNRSPGMCQVIIGDTMNLSSA